MAQEGRRVRVIYKNGLPYGPEIRKLREAFPVASLVEGKTIGHETLEEILEQKRGSPRYYGIVNSWIKRERNENGLYLVWEPARGVKVLNPAELLTHAEHTTRSKLRQTGRAVRMFGWVDRSRLDAVGQQRLDHQARVANAIRDSLESAKKELAIDLAPIKSLPKPKLIRPA